MYEGVVPKLTSTTIYPNYLPGVVSASSERVPWQGVLVRTFHQPAQLEMLKAPGVPDLKIVMQLEGSIHLERQIEGSPGNKGTFILATLPSFLLSNFPHGAGTSPSPYYTCISHQNYCVRLH